MYVYCQIMFGTLLYLERILQKSVSDSLSNLTDCTSPYFKSSPWCYKNVNTDRIPVQCHCHSNSVYTKGIVTSTLFSRMNFAAILKISTQVELSGCWTATPNSLHFFSPSRILAPQISHAHSSGVKSKGALRVKINLIQTKFQQKVEDPSSGVEDF